MIDTLAAPKLDLNIEQVQFLGRPRIPRKVTG